MRSRVTLAATALGLFLAIAVAAPAHAVPQSWDASVNVGTSGDAERPSVMIAPDGSITSIWMQNSVSGSTIFSSTSTDSGATWSMPLALSATNYSVTYPALAIDTAGARTATWVSSDGTNTIIQTATSPNGISWYSPVTISTAGSDSTFPQVTTNSAGKRFISWQSLVGGNVVAQVASSPDGLTWGSPVTVSDPALNADSPRIGVLPAGDVILVWGIGTGIQSSSSYNAGTNWSNPVDLVAQGQTTGQPVIAISSAGLISAVWYRADGGGYYIGQAATSTDAQTWSTPVDLSATGGYAQEFSIAFAPNGTIHVAWTFQGTVTATAQTAHSSDNGASWSSPVDLSDAGYDASEAQVMTDSASNVTVAWTQDNAAANQIIESASSTDGGATFGARTNVSGTDQGAMWPRLALDASDALTAVWVMNNGTNSLVQTAKSNQTVAAASGGSGTGGAVLAATGVPSTAGPTALLGAGLIAAGLVAVYLRPRRAAHRA